MASSEDISCVGCGEDITNAKGKRNLCHEASKSCGKHRKDIVAQNKVCQHSLLFIFQ